MTDAPGSEFLDRIAVELARGPLNLPCFPDVVPRVRAAINDPRTRPDDLVRIVGTEPRLAARLVQTVNSAVFNPSGKPVTNLRQAVTRLGHHLVQSVTMVFAIQQMKADASLKTVAKPLSDLWEKSVAVASLCEVLAKQLKVPADRVFLAGLLHGIGHFYIMVRAAEPSSTAKYAELSTELLAERHPALGRAVLEKWGFEEILCEAVASQRDYGRVSKRAADITDIVIASVVLAEALLESDGDLARCADVTAFERLGLGPKELEATLMNTQYRLGSLRDTLGC
ncbi:MAG TPA: HDOD domain-containing protein [Steroidobacteraceae bacterium]|nr:HDOD domain-containing protein [Steroidobacteraceae bacterium]